MLVSHSHQFIFLKTRKTAGTSVEMALQPYCVEDREEEVPEFTSTRITPRGIVARRGPDSPDLPLLDRIWYNHMPAARVAELLGQRLWTRYRRILTIRNPFERVVSYYYFLVWQEKLPAPSDLASARRHLTDRLLSRPLPDDREIAMIDGRLVADRIIRYESLAEDVASLIDELDPGGDWRPSLPWTKLLRKGWLGPLPDHFEPASIEQVRRRYAWMFEAGGYPDLPQEASPTPGPGVKATAPFLSPATHA